MALHPTASQLNLEKSLTKFFIDNLVTTEGVHVEFDKGFTVPGKSIESWCYINFENLAMDDLSELVIQIVLGTVRDTNGVELATLRDIVMSYLSDSTSSDGLRRIPFYNVSDWSTIGGLVFFLMSETGKTIASNEAKYKIINCRVRWGTVI